MEEKHDGIRWRDIPADVVRAAVVDLVGRALSLVLLSACAGVVLLIVVGGSIPAWVAAVIAVGAAVIVYASRRRVRTFRTGISTRDETIATLQPLADRVPELENDLESCQWATQRHQTYGYHVCEMLELLRKVLTGQTPGVSIGDFITRGVLQPARDMLGESPAEGVRLSILHPRDGYFEMLFSAGHRLESHEKYRLRIADSLSRIALEDGILTHWDDVTEDSRFSANLQATRPFCSMVSMPIIVGANVGAVFNVIATNPEAFDPTDVTYIAALGTIIAVAIGVLSKGAGAT
jgi:hypothetical protein